MKICRLAHANAPAPEVMSTRTRRPSPTRRLLRFGVSKMRLEIYLPGQLAREPLAPFGYLPPGPFYLIVSGRAL